MKYLSKAFIAAITLILAYNCSDNEDSVDNSGPAIEFLTPSKGQNLVFGGINSSDSEVADIQILITDDSAVSGAKLEIKNETGDIVATYFSQYTAGSSSLRFENTFIPESTGTFLIQCFAEDNLGNTSYSDIVFIRYIN